MPEDRAYKQAQYRRNRRAPAKARPARNVGPDDRPVSRATSPTEQLKRRPPQSTPPISDLKDREIDLILEQGLADSPHLRLYSKTYEQLEGARERARSGPVRRAVVNAFVNNMRLTAPKDEEAEEERLDVWGEQNVMEPERRQMWDEERERSIGEYNKLYGGWLKRLEWAPPAYIALAAGHGARVAAEDPSNAWDRFSGQGKFDEEYKARETFKRRHGRYPVYGDELDRRWRRVEQSRRAAKFKAPR